MRDTLRLSVIVGEAALIVTSGCFALTVTLILCGFNPEQQSPWTKALFVVAYLLPIGVVAGWMFRKLRAVYSTREARAVSIAFGVLTPISLGVSMVLAEITGGYADAFTRLRFSGLVGAFVGAAVMTALLSFLACALTLRITQLAISVERSD